MASAWGLPDTGSTEISLMSSIVSLAADASFPLTPTQKGMLYHRLLAEHSGIDVQQLIVDLPSDASSFRRECARMLDRNEALRTFFRWEGLAEPVQGIAASAALPWADRAWKGDASFEAFLRDDRARGFALDQPPLMRFTSFRLPDGGHRVVWTSHHALLDSNSVAILLGELMGAEAARVSRPFRELVEWLALRKSSEAYWRGALRGFSAPTPLPHAFHAPGALGSGELEITPGSDVATLAKDLDVTIETFIVGAWSILAARMSGERDVVQGVARSRRPPGFEGSIGLFINTVPVRVRVDHAQTASSLLSDLEAQQEVTREHEHTPLSDAQRWSDVAAGTHLFDTLLVFDDTPVRLIERTAYPLTLTVYTLPALSIRLAWDRNRLDDDTAQRVSRSLLILLEELARDPHRPVRSLPILSNREKQQIVVDWNDTARSIPLPGGIHELVEKQADSTPDRIAVRSGDESLTYRELDRRANRVARRLRQLGVGPEVLVGILMERCPDLIAALLGILKAGGAYVPIDPLYPADRITYMLENARAPVVVTQSALAGRAAASNAAVVCLDPGWERSAPESDDPVPSSSGGESLAYVIYTSGSTGKPKGVQIPHRAVVNFLRSMREEPGLHDGDVLLAVTTLSFDIAGLEIYLPLTTGARIELVSREIAADGRRLKAVLSQTGATVLQATPATWRMLLESGWSGDPGLKVLCGGEAMPRDLAEQLLPRCASLWNMYGPTETTIWSTVERVERFDDTANVTIGRPIANTQVYLLDEWLQPVPIGVAGELFIGGTGVARGYQDRPDLTGERFLPDPFSTVPGARIYRTGDAARYRPDGRIEYLQRLDHQVKVRGYRIELGEIEAVLRRHPAVRDAVVTLRTGVPGGQALVAYVVANDQVPSSGELREALKETLPESMVPAYFVELDSFPLTPNGKVDRSSLPAPERTGRESEETFVPPRDVLETRLAALWSDVLGVPDIGVRDDFFELGGDSLLALRLFLRIEQAFGKQLPLAALIEASTVEGLAVALREERWEAPWSPLVAIQPAGARRPLFCVHGVGGNVVNYRALAQHLGPDQPFYALQARGLDGKEPPLTRIEDMAALYLAEVRAVRPEGPYSLGGLSFGGVVAFEMAQQLRAAGQEVSLLALFDTAPVGYSKVARTGQVDERMSRRLGVHLQVLLRGPNRLAYARKRVRRVWRKIVYRSWQTVHAVFAKLQRPLPAALQNVQQANYLALRNYRPGIYPGRVVFFYADGEPEGFTREKQQGWSVLAAGGVASARVPGDHLTLLDEPHVGALARQLARHLEEVHEEAQP